MTDVSDHRQILYVNSRNRISGTDSNFVFKLPLVSPNDFDSIVVLQACIPKSFYNVKDGFNTFTLSEISGLVDITVPAGNYTRASFSVSIKNLLNSNSPGGYTYSVSYSNVNTEVDDGKYVFSVSGNSGDQPEFIFPDSTESVIFEPMGFNYSSTNIFSGNSLTSTNVINLQSENAIFIHSNIVNNSYLGASTPDDILQEIYSNAGSASYSNIYLLQQDPDCYSKKINNQNSDTFTFTITNENNTILDLHGVPCQFTLLAYRRKSDTSDIIRNFIQFVTSWLIKKG